MPISYGARD